MTKWSYDEVRAIYAERDKYRELVRAFVRRAKELGDKGQGSEFESKSAESSLVVDVDLVTEALRVLDINTSFPDDGDESHEARMRNDDGYRDGYQQACMDTAVEQLRRSIGG